MKSTQLFSAITFLLWLLFVFLGSSALDGVRSQHVSGFPSREQMYYYLYIPLGVTLVIAIAWRSLQVPSFRKPALICTTLALLGLFPYLFFFTGGI